MTDPETIFPGGTGTSRISERLATVLPEPDSPTIPTVSPCLTSKLIPSTALTVPSSVSKYTRSSLTLRRFPLLSAVMVSKGSGCVHLPGKVVREHADGKAASQTSYQRREPNRHAIFRRRPSGIDQAGNKPCRRAPDAHRVMKRQPSLQHKA